jgi:hypothetical protein
MPDQGFWISLQGAVVAVYAVTGGPPGPVYQTLISICAQGLVRARWTAHASGARPAIHKREWIGADIDWSGPSGTVVKADGRRMAGVDLSEEDLKAWAAATRRPVPVSRKATGGRKRKTALEAIKACFPDAPPIPEHIENKAVLAIVFAWLKQHRPEAEMDNITVLRAAERAK